MCNQAAGLSRCLTKVQDEMFTQIKNLHSVKGKGNSSERTQQAVNELEYLLTFNRSISQAMARTMQDLSEGVFISVSNFTLARHDSYLEYLHAGVKQDTLTALRTAPIHLQSLFLDWLHIKAEEEVTRSEERLSSRHFNRKPGRFHPNMLSMTEFHNNRTGSRPSQLGSKYINVSRDRKVMASLPLSHRNRPRVQNNINDNYCVQSVTGLKDFACVPGQKSLNPSPQGFVQQERDCIFTCKLLCCKCSFCHRVATKERRKSQLLLQSNRNKICERCFLCRSLEFCKYCHKCPNCCTSTCRGNVTSVLGEVGSSEFESKSSFNSERWLHPPLPVQTQSNQVTNCHKQLCQPTKTVKPFGGTVSADEQKCSGNGSKPKLTGFLQPAIFGTQTQQPVETYHGPEYFEHLPKHRVVQNGDPRDNKDLPTVGGVGHLHRLQGRILPYTNSQSVQEVHAFPHPGSVLPVQSPTLWPVHSTHGVHSGGQRGQTDGFTEECKNPPVPRRLVGERHVPPNLSPAYTDLGSSLSRTWLAGEQGEVRTGPKTGFQLRRLPVRPQGKVRPTPERWQTLTDKIVSILSGVPGLAVHVPYRTSNSHRKASPLRSTSYETHTVALEEQLKDTRITRKGDSSAQVAPPSLKMVAGGKQCASRSTITPSKTCSADIDRCMKRRVGHSLK